MNRTPRHYAQAFVGALRDGGDGAALIANLLRSVDKHNDRRKLSSIVATIETLLIKERGGAHITITSARELAPATRATLGALAGANDVMTFATDPTLVAGVTIAKNRELELDYSFAGAIGHLFN